MPNTPAYYLAAITAVILIGLAKGGFSGLGSLATPILALVVPPSQAAAILLPILVVQDVVSVWAFRNSWNRHILSAMIPGGLIGVALGWAFAAMLSQTAVLGALGATSVAFGLWRLWTERGGRMPTASTSPGWVGTLFGGLSGFCSQIAHAGAPPFQMWVTPKQLPHREFVGTAAVFFAVTNWAKVPAYIALGQFTRPTLQAAGLLMPLAIASTFAGVWLIRRVTGRIFYVIVYLMMIGLGLQLLREALLA